MFIAEREGFEPPVPFSTAVFKTAVIDHSTISPYIGLLFEKRCKGKFIFSMCKACPVKSFLKNCTYRTLYSLFLRAITI